MLNRDLQAQLAELPLDREVTIDVVDVGFLEIKGVDNDTENPAAAIVTEELPAHFLAAKKAERGPFNVVLRTGGGAAELQEDILVQGVSQIQASTTLSILAKYFGVTKITNYGRTIETIGRDDADNLFDLQASIEEAL